MQEVSTLCSAPSTHEGFSSLHPVPRWGEGDRSLLIFSQLQAAAQEERYILRNHPSFSLHRLFELLRVGFDFLQIFSAKSAIRGEVMVVLHDVFVKGDDGSIETRIIDGDVAPFARLPGTVLHLPLFELGCHQLRLQYFEPGIRATGL